MLLQLNTSGSGASQMGTLKVSGVIEDGPPPADGPSGPGMI